MFETLFNIVIHLIALWVTPVYICVKFGWVAGILSYCVIHTCAETIGD